jgi:putative SOS response-associated peptidase YedK
VNDIMRAANANGLSMFPISPDVNSVKNDRPDLIRRVPESVVEKPRQTSLF